MHHYLAVTQRTKFEFAAKEIQCIESPVQRICGKRSNYMRANTVKSTFQCSKPGHANYTSKYSAVFSRNYFACYLCAWMGSF